MEFKPFLAARCPFCDGDFQVGEVDEVDPAILHSVPPCEKFYTLEMPEYLREIRIKLFPNDLS